jgi:hypothetical protein
VDPTKLFCKHLNGMETYESRAQWVGFMSAFSKNKRRGTGYPVEYYSVTQTDSVPQTLSCVLLNIRKIILKLISVKYIQWK